MGGISPDEVERLLEQVSACHTFDQFAGRTEELRRERLRRPGKPVEGGVTTPVEIAGADLFGTPVWQGECWLHLASVVSVDAEAVRLQVDLSELAYGDEAWILSPSRFRSYGPYSREDGLRWLPCVEGEESVLLVRSARHAAPAVRLASYSHVFLALDEIAKALLLDCHVDLACETDAAVIENATATAIIMVAGSWFCTGTLLNNDRTVELEPFFITANHCVCGGDYARDTEVYWDFRDSACGANDAPTLEELPRSSGTKLLATHSGLDASLIQLDAVPSGAYGRLYAGWDAGVAEIGDAVYTLHFPQADHMRITRGAVTGIDDDEGIHRDQLKVHWDEGVTEAGSSGGGLFYADSHQYAGTLSQGPYHTCGPDRSGNVDWFASLHRFYAYAARYIDSVTPSDDEAPDDCLDDGICPFTLIYADDARVLQKFRAFRDHALADTGAGRQMIDLWYACAPKLAQVMDRSPAVRRVFTAVSSAAARWLPDQAR